MVRLSIEWAAPIRLEQSRFGSVIVHLFARWR